jgi:DNA-binding MarR family transcriptional regulator
MPNKDMDLRAQAEELARLTFLLARVCEEKEQHFTKMFNLTNAEFRCMRLLKDNCYLSVKELAKVMGLTPGRITHIITGLEKKHYVIREIDTNDRRNIRLCLTENAIPFMVNVTQNHVNLHEKVIKNIPEETRDSVLIAINELLQSLTVWSKTKEV